MAIQNCPNCGQELDRRFAAAKMTTCVSCRTSLFIESGHVTDAGESGEMHDAPMLFQVGQTAIAHGEAFNILGHARFDYGPGWWDEFFAVSQGDEEVWISVDEGEVIVQRALTADDAPKGLVPPELGSSVASEGMYYRIIERDTATCIAFRGEFPEVLQVGTTYTYVNCRGASDTLLSGEFSTGAPDWYKGRWLDPYDLEIVSHP